MDMIMVEEWIGLRAKITDSANPNDIGITGEIIGETLNTIIVLTDSNERKTIQKKGARALVEGRGEILELSCAVCRPEDRTKKLYKKVIA